MYLYDCKTIIRLRLGEYRRILSSTSFWLLIFIDIHFVLGECLSFDLEKTNCTRNYPIMHTNKIVSSPFLAAEILLLSSNAVTKMDVKPKQTIQQFNKLPNFMDNS